MPGKYYSIRMRAADAEGRHISGAEGIYEEAASNPVRLVAAYTRRALKHPRGVPADIVVTLQELKLKPRPVDVLPVNTVTSADTDEAELFIREYLSYLGISKRAIRAGLSVIRGKRVMRGAALIDANTGRRLDSLEERGVRVTLMGMLPKSITSIKRKLSRRGIPNTQAVIEALTLASKVVSAPGVMAELCASDDPGYIIGYLASERHGYMRIENIKVEGSMSGGRVFFIKPGADMDKTIAYLQQTPVLVG